MLSQSGPAVEFKSFHSQTRLQQLGQQRYVLTRWLSGFQHTALLDCWILDSTKSAMMGLDHRHVLCLDLPCIRSTWKAIACGEKEPWHWLMGSGEGALWPNCIWLETDKLGSDGVISVTEAILEDELRRRKTSYGVNDTRGSDPRALFRRNKHGTDGLPRSCYNALNVWITQNWGRHNWWKFHHASELVNSAISWLFSI